MGNQHSNKGLKRTGSDTKGAPIMMSNGSGANSKRGSVAESQSSNDVQDKFEKPANLLQPTEKLAKFLLQKSQQLDNKNGITMKVFQTYLFPRYSELGNHLFNYFLKKANSKHSYLSTSAFKQQCDKLFSILDDEAIRDYLVQMFSEEADGQYTITTTALHNLLMCGYHVAMDHYSEGPQMCFSISKTLASVEASCFHKKDSLSSSFVSHWLGTNAPRLLLPMHRYTVHILATAYRTIDKEGPTLAAGLELTTPVLEQPPSMPSDHKVHHQPFMLTMSMSWLLAGALPPMYSRPQKAHSPSSSGSGLSNINFLSKFLSSIPSHWLNLYDSNEMGLGLNRFQYHVLAYKGATLTLLKADNGAIFCIAAPCEWKESNLFWGGEETCLFQLMPTFGLLEKGSKMLFFNTAIRGYPMGVRIGKDPRAPIITIDGGFEKIEYKKIPYTLDSVEVWGCGDQQIRDVQLDIKKWQVKEAERQRCVKLSAADWLDHPDRYLLELAGRPQYHQKQN